MPFDSANREALIDRSSRAERYAGHSLDRQVRAILEPEGIKAPPLRVHIALVKHETAEDVAAFAEEMRSSHIVIAENYGASADTLKLAQALSNGLITLEQMEQMRSVGSAGENPMGGFLKAFDETLYGSNAKVAHVDVRSSDPAFSKVHTQIRIAEAHHEAIVTKRASYDEASVRAADSRRIMEETILTRRNEHMIAQLALQIASVIRTTPELQASKLKGPLKVFMFLGAKHEDVATQLQASGTKVVARQHKAGRIAVRADRLATKSGRGNEVTQKDGELIVRETILGFAYEVIGRAMPPEQNPFQALEERNVGTILAPRILADVCARDSRAVYEAYPGDLLTQEFSEDPEIRGAQQREIVQKFVEFYQSILTKYKGKIAHEVKKWVRIVDQTEDRV